MQSPVLHRPDIDGLRAVAIMAVLAFHAFPSALPGGFAGVDVFFVISGYVVSLSLFTRRTHGWSAAMGFYARRIRRLFPALCIMLLAVSAAAYFVLPQAQLAMLGKHVLGSAAFVQNGVLWQESGYFDATSTQKWLLHLWSLGIEEQFYWLMPLLLWLGRGVSVDAASQSRRWPLSLALCMFASLGVCLWQSMHAPSAGFYGPIGRLWEFLLGVALAAWHMRTKPNSTRQPLSTGMTNLAAMVALLMLCGSLWALREQGWRGWQFPGPMALWPTLATLVLLALPTSWVNRQILSLRGMAYVGLLSYPLYLWHWPLLAYLNGLDPHHKWAWTRVGAVVLALALAAATFHWVEQPLRRWAKRSDQLARLTWGCLGMMSVVALIGLGLWRNPQMGWQARHTQAMAQQVLWRETTLYRDEVCIAHEGVNPWRRNDFFCRGNPDTASWVLLGDSHANALAAGMLAAMPGQWLNLGGGGCMPFGGVDSGADHLGLQCPHTLPEAFLRHITTSPTIHSVLIDLRGAYYVEGTGVGPAEAGVRRWLRQAGASGGPDSDNATLFRAGVRRTLAELGASNKRVFWLLDTPEIGADVTSCLHPLLGQGWLGPQPICSVPLVAMSQRNGRYRAIVYSEVARWNAQVDATHHVRVLDPVEALCTDGHCPVVLNGIPLYRDGDHLSIPGAKRLTEWLMPLLTP